MRSRFAAVLFVTVFYSLFVISGPIQGGKNIKKGAASSGVSPSALRALEQNSVLQIGSRLRTLFDERGISMQSRGTDALSTHPAKKLLLPSQVSDGKLRTIRRDPESGTPRFIELAAPAVLHKAAGTLSAAMLDANAREFLASYSAILLIDDPQNEFSLQTVQTDMLGQSHLRYRQTYRGLEIWAKDIIVHTDGAGMVTAFNGIYEPTPTMMADITGGVAESDAVATALADVRRMNGGSGLSADLARLHRYSGPAAKKAIWYDRFHVPHLAWVVEVRPSLEADMNYFIDARSGRILDSYNNVCYDGVTTGTGVDLNGATRTFGTYQSGSEYYMMDAAEPMFDTAKSTFPNEMIGAIIGLDLRNQDLTSSATLYFSTSGSTQWTDPSAVSAHYNGIVTYNYYRTHFGRNSIDDKGMTIYSTIHATENGKAMENAFWSGQLMCYGDGGTYFKPLAGGLDVAAHEMTHGVTQYTSNLEYKDQSGALNESISDVFGALVDSLNWTMGETIVKNLTAFPSGSLRDLANPHNGASSGSGAWQPASMSEFVATTQDNGGVHTNSGIPNRAFYLTASSIGRPYAGQIWYRAVSYYLTRSSQFIDARLATEKAATDLFGAGSAQRAAVSAAWDGVGVGAANPTPPPVPTALEGQNWVLVTNTDPNDPNSLYMVAPALTGGSSDYFALSTTRVKNRPAVSDASGVILFIDGQNNLRVVFANPQNPNESVIDASGIWGSVAIGPGLSSLALTSIYQDTTIYYIDLVAGTNAAFKIATKSYDAANAKTALFADALSFDPTGKFLLFDTYNEVKNGSGGTINFWNINILDIEQQVMDNVFPPLSEGINVGNPSYSKTSTTRFAFDYFDSNKNQYYAYAADFNSSSVGLVAGPQTAISYPTYSGDDKIIAYHTIERAGSIDHDAILQMPMNSNLIEGSGTSTPYLVDATYPCWFVVGTRTTGIETKPESKPTTFSLLQNYPNPFNPTTTIEYSIPKTSFVTLNIYNALGQKVETLVSGEMNAGKHSAIWDAAEYASGVYCCRITAGERMQTIKLILQK